MHVPPNSDEMLLIVRQTCEEDDVSPCTKSNPLCVPEGPHCDTKRLSDELLNPSSGAVNPERESSSGASTFGSSLGSVVGRDSDNRSQDRNPSPHLTPTAEALGQNETVAALRQASAVAFKANAPPEALHGLQICDAPFTAKEQVQKDSPPPWSTPSPTPSPQSPPPQLPLQQPRPSAPPQHQKQQQQPQRARVPGEASSGALSLPPASQFTVSDVRRSRSYRAASAMPAVDDSVTSPAATAPKGLTLDGAWSSTSNSNSSSNNNTNSPAAVKSETSREPGINVEAEVSAPALQPDAMANSLSLHLSGSLSAPSVTALSRGHSASPFSASRGASPNPAASGPSGSSGSSREGSRLHSRVSSMADEDATFIPESQRSRLSSRASAFGPLHTSAASEDATIHAQAGRPPLTAMHAARSGRNDSGERDGEAEGKTGAPSEPLSRASSHPASARSSLSNPHGPSMDGSLSVQSLCESDDSRRGGGAASPVVGKRATASPKRRFRGSDCGGSDCALGSPSLISMIDQALSPQLTGAPVKRAPDTTALSSVYGPPTNGALSCGSGSTEPGKASLLAPGGSGSLAPMTVPSTQPTPAGSALTAVRVGSAVRQQGAAPSLGPSLAPVPPKPPPAARGAIGATGLFFTRRLLPLASERLAQRAQLAGAPPL